MEETQSRDQAAVLTPADGCTWRQLLPGSPPLTHWASLLPLSSSALTTPHSCLHSPRLNVCWDWWPLLLLHESDAIFFCLLDGDSPPVSVAGSRPRICPAPLPHPNIGPASHIPQAQHWPCPHDMRVLTTCSAGTFCYLLGV